MATTRRIALLVDTSTGWGRRVIRGVLKYAEKHGPWDICVEQRGQTESMRLPAGWKGDGIIARVGSTNMAKYLHSTRVPVVNVSAIHIRNYHFPTVTTDTDALVKLALAHFLDRGLRHFAYVGLANRSYSFERQQAFYQLCLEAGFDCHTFRSPQSNTNWQHRREALKAWLSSLPKPIGVLTWGVERGVELISEAKNADLQVPDEVAILGSDDDELLCESVQPSLSGIIVPAEQVGHEAAALLNDMLTNRRAKKAARRLIAPLGLTARASTDLLAINDMDVVAAIRYIQGAPDQPLRICDVSKAVAVSQRSLERRFQKYVGRTIAEIISESHVARAKLLLATTDLPMYQIAAKSGFSSPEYMATVFRKETGVSPRTYRTEAQGR